MALPIIYLLSATGRILHIIVRAGTALSSFIARNPKILGSTISITSISNALSQRETTEQEKIKILKEIEIINPQAYNEIIAELGGGKGLFDINININKILPIIIILIIIYLYMSKNKK